MDDLCLGGNTPNSLLPPPAPAPTLAAGPSPEDELLSLRSNAVSIGARTGFIAGVFRPEDVSSGGDSPPVSDAGMGGESGSVDGVATGYVA